MMDPFEISLIRDLILTLFNPNEIIRLASREEFTSVRLQNGLEFYIKGHLGQYCIICNHVDEIPATYLLSMRSLDLINVKFDPTLSRKPSTE